MLKHQGSLPLSTQRLLLRPFQRDDAPALYRDWSDQELMRYLWQPFSSISQAEERIERWLEMYEELHFYNWAIIANDSNEVIGSVSIHSINEAREEGALGCSLAKAYWHQGIMTEAMKAIIEFAFGQVGFSALEGKAQVANIGSIKVMQKCGMIYQKREDSVDNFGKEVKEEVYRITSSKEIQES